MEIGTLLEKMNLQMRIVFQKKKKIPIKIKQKPSNEWYGIHISVQMCMCLLLV